MNVLVDTNVWLDIILNRAPHVGESARAVNLLSSHGSDHRPFVCAHAVTTIFYLVAKSRDHHAATRAVDALLNGADVVAVDGSILRRALTAEVRDFEDAVVERASVREGLDAIVTRNASDFDASELAIYTPSELAAALTA